MSAALIKICCPNQRNPIRCRTILSRTLVSITRSTGVSQTLQPPVLRHDSSSSRTRLECFSNRFSITSFGCPVITWIARGNRARRRSRRSYRSVPGQLSSTAIRPSFLRDSRPSSGGTKRQTFPSHPDEQQPRNDH